jgi:dihydrofolate reductase
MEISMIVAHGKNYELGLKNKLLWNIPEDLQNFKNLTMGHHILMGRKTFESIGKPLPNRISLVISSNPPNESDDENVFWFDCVDSAIEFAKEKNECELFVIGGSIIYNQMMHRCDTLYISEVDFQGEADVFLNPVNYDEFQLVSEVYHKPITNPLKISVATTISHKFSFSNPRIPGWRFKKLKRICEE